MALSFEVASGIIILAFMAFVVYMKEVRTWFWKPKGAHVSLPPFKKNPRIIDGGVLGTIGEIVGREHRQGNYWKINTIDIHSGTSSATIYDVNNELVELDRAQAMLDTSPTYYIAKGTLYASFNLQEDYNTMQKRIKQCQEDALYWQREYRNAIANKDTEAQKVFDNAAKLGKALKSPMNRRPGGGM